MAEFAVGAVQHNNNDKGIDNNNHEKEEVSSDVDFDDLDDEQGVDVNEGVVLLPVTPSRDGWTTVHSQPSLQL